MNPPSALAPAPESPSRSPLALELDLHESNFDPKLHLYGGPGPSIGYHTRLTPKDWVHPTRENFMFAAALLAEGSPARIQRALDMLDVLLERQDVRDDSKTYGIWSWYVEEPLEKMNPPDWNWAAFCGMQIGIILVHFPALLPPELEARMKTAIGHCARSIIRRDIKANYTNIAYLGSLVTLVAGDVLEEPQFTQYGRTLLTHIGESLDYHGNYNEYNSPTYTLLLIQVCDCLLQTARDKQALALAERLRQRTWEIIAAYFHPATAQWAGPQSRSYGTWLDGKTVREISARIGHELPYRSKSGERGVPDCPAIRKLPCPPGIAGRFQALPGDNYELKQRFIRKEPDARSVRGTTWFSREACLGTVNEESCWTQGRVLLGYWRTEEDMAVQLRMRFLHDGHDFVSCWSTHAQSGPRVLTALSFLIENGDYHPVFYFPEGSRFEAKDFRLRYELCGNGVSAAPTADGRFELRAGGFRALIQPMEGTFNGQPVKWELTKIENGVALDGICHAGPAKTFAFKELPPSFLAASLELLPQETENPALVSHSRVIDGANSHITWAPGQNPLHVHFSALPHLKP